MFRINDIIDLPVVQSMSSKRLCTIRDVIIDMREARVYALVCRERIFRRSLEAILFSNITAITQNSIAIVGNINKISVRELSMKHRRFQSYRNMLGKMVLSPKGEALGITRDLLIDTDSGIINAFELSEGYLDDILKGRRIMKLDCGHMLSGASIILKDYNAQCWFDSK
ncbi:MAG TPA: PRC-barrel domain-containing protein [Clostridia bacterium]|nr:PRC-barrel domain-containing protein [Clostridia bacterium]